MSISCDKPVEMLPDVFGNIELATESLRHLRDRMMEDGNPTFADASVTIGLYLQYMEQLLRKGREVAQAT